MKHSNLFRVFIVLAPVLILFMTSCRVLYPNVMLTTPRGYEFDTLKLDSATFATEYRLAPNDVIEFRLFANDGYKMIDLISAGPGQNNNAMVRQGFDYYMDSEGNVKLPILGLVNLDSMTLREAEIHLEERYSKYYVKPFAVVKVANRRVTIFPGEAGDAQVIQLQNNNTTVFEAIALAGGISTNGKAHKIKLIRPTDDPAHPNVYLIDLSTIEGIQQGSIVVQSNDIIYIEPRRKFASRTLTEVAPIVSLFSTAVTLYFLFSRL
ncbi:MAG TPA: polysaccharide biosynthesis/export family protein [Bacteroidia bacterium]|nr:polysaccharide biosynthesis/export family protein [Bacteroidia bacterium]